MIEVLPVRGGRKMRPARSWSPWALARRRKCIRWSWRGSMRRDWLTAALVLLVSAVLGGWRGAESAAVGAVKMAGSIQAPSWPRSRLTLLPRPWRPGGSASSPRPGRTRTGPWRTSPRRWVGAPLRRAVRGAGPELL